MKYEVGDKFLIEVVSVLKSGYLMSNNTFLEEHKLKDSDKYTYDRDMIYEAGVEHGLEKACACMKKLFLYTPVGFNAHQLESIFGMPNPNNIIEEYSFKEIIEKIDAYLLNEEKERENIKVGDIVTINDGDIRFVVTKSDFDGDENRCSLMAFDGSVWEGCPKEMCQKTGISVNFSNVLGQLEGCATFIEPLEVTNVGERIS